jgi:hypothetical protein
MVVDVTVRIEGEWVIIPFAFHVVDSPYGKENGRTFRNEHAFIPIIRGGTARKSSGNTELLVK